MDDVTSLKVLLDNWEKYDGTHVKLRLFVRAGFDGAHVVCEGLNRKFEIGKQDRILLNSELCFALSESKELWQEWATVSGIFEKAEVPFIVFPYVYESEIINPQISFK